MQLPTVHHYFSYTKNIGDYFVKDGIKKLIMNKFSNADIIDIPINNPRNLKISAFKAPGLTKENLKYSNKKADFIIIGGSNLYEAPESSIIIEDLDYLKKIDKKLALIGIGTGSAFMEKRVKKLNSKSFLIIKRLNDVSFISEVRDIITQEFLDKYKINTQMYGCPANFIFNNELKRNTNKNILISCPPARFMQGFVLSYKKIKSRSVFKAFSKYIDYVISIGYKPIILCNDDRDLPIATEIVNKRAEIFYSEKTQDWYELFISAFLVIGFRLHTAILSFGMGIPFLTFNLDMRNEGFIKTFQLDNLKIDIFKLDTINQMIRNTEKILNNQVEFFKVLNSKKAFMYNKFHNLLLDL
jgi:polysaccharide pyruvyl transferase WcaK-like protein